MVARPCRQENSRTHSISCKPKFHALRSHSSCRYFCRCSEISFSANFGMSAFRTSCVAFCPTCIRNYLSFSPNCQQRLLKLLRSRICKSSVFCGSLILLLQQVSQTDRQQKCFVSFCAPC